MKNFMENMKSTPEFTKMGEMMEECCRSFFEKVSEADKAKKKDEPSIPYDELFGRHDTELMLLAASVAGGCLPCTKHHIKKVKASGITDKEIDENLAIAIGVREEATAIMKKHALQQSENKEGLYGTESEAENATRLKELIVISAAYAVNSAPIIEEHLQICEELGITNQEIHIATKMASRVQKQARANVDKIIDRMVSDSADEINSNGGCGC